MLSEYSSLLHNASSSGLDGAAGADEADDVATSERKLAAALSRTTDSLTRASETGNSTTRGGSGASGSVASRSGAGGVGGAGGRGGAGGVSGLDVDGNTGVTIIPIPALASIPLTSTLSSLSSRPAGGPGASRSYNNQQQQQQQPRTLMEKYGSSSSSISSTSSTSALLDDVDHDAEQDPDRYSLSPEKPFAFSSSSSYSTSSSSSSSPSKNNSEYSIADADYDQYDGLLFRSRTPPEAALQGRGIYKLNPDILQRILSFLPAPSLAVIARVSTEFRRVAYDSVFWDTLDLSPRCRRLDDNIALKLLRQPRFRKLKRLSLEGCSALTDRFLEQLPRLCPQLEVLLLTDCSSFTTATLHDVALALPLKMLELYGTTNDYSLALPISSHHRIGAGIDLGRFWLCYCASVGRHIDPKKNDTPTCRHEAGGRNHVGCWGQVRGRVLYSCVEYERRGSYPTEVLFHCENHKEEDLVSPDVYKCAICDKVFRRVSMWSESVCALCHDLHILAQSSAWISLPHANLESLSFSQVLSKLVLLHHDKNLPTTLKSYGKVRFTVDTNIPMVEMGRSIDGTKELVSPLRQLSATMSAGTSTSTSTSTSAAGAGAGPSRRTGVHTLSSLDTTSASTSTSTSAVVPFRSSSSSSSSSASSSSSSLSSSNKAAVRTAWGGADSIERKTPLLTSASTSTSPSSSSSSSSSSSLTVGTDATVTPFAGLFTVTSPPPSAASSSSSSSANRTGAGGGGGAAAAAAVAAAAAAAGAGAGAGGDIAQRRAIMDEAARAEDPFPADRRQPGPFGLHDVGVGLDNVANRRRRRQQGPVGDIFNGEEEDERQLRVLREQQVERQRRARGGNGAGAAAAPMPDEDDDIEVIDESARLVPLGTFLTHNQEALDRQMDAVSSALVAARNAGHERALLCVAQGDEVRVLSDDQCVMSQRREEDMYKTNTVCQNVSSLLVPFIVVMAIVLYLIHATRRLVRRNNYDGTTDPGMYLAASGSGDIDSLWRVLIIIVSVIVSFVLCIFCLRRCANCVHLFVHMFRVLLFLEVVLMFFIGSLTLALIFVYDWSIPIEPFSFYIVIANLTVVGTASMYFDQAPNGLRQVFLVLINIIFAYVFVTSLPMEFIIVILIVMCVVDCYSMMKEDQPIMPFIMPATFQMLYTRPRLWYAIATLRVRAGEFIWYGLLIGLADIIGGIFLVIFVFIVIMGSLAFGAFVLPYKGVDFRPLVISCIIAFFACGVSQHMIEPFKNSIGAPSTSLFSFSF